VEELGMVPIMEKPMAFGCTKHKCYCGYMLSETQFCHDTKFYSVLCYHGFMLSKTWYHGKKIVKKRGDTVQNGGKNMLDETCHSITLKKFQSRSLQFSDNDKDSV